MFLFFPQLLIILSVAAIIVLLLRKIPGVREFVSQTPVRRLPAYGTKILGAKIWAYTLQYANKLWHFVLEVKDISRSRTFSRLPATFKNIHFPKPHLGKLPFLKSADSPEFYVQRALDLTGAENFAEAERTFIKAIEKDPRSEAAYNGLGKLYLSQNKFDEAIETYKFLVKHHPENDGYYAGLGQAYHGQKLYDQAMEAYERAIELAPENARRYVNLGLTLEARKHLEEAILNYRKALDLEKTDTQIMMILADALVKKGDREEAELFLEQILQAEPTNHLAREKLMQLKF